MNSSYKAVPSLAETMLMCLISLQLAYKISEQVEGSHAAKVHHPSYSHLYG